MGLAKKQCMKGQYPSVIGGLELTNFLKIKRRKNYHRTEVFKRNRTELHGLVKYNLSPLRDITKGFKSAVCDS